MDALSAGLVAEIACHAPDWSAIERTLVPLLAEQIGADTVFFADQSGLGDHTFGLLAPLRSEINPVWREYTPSVLPLIDQARRTGGVIVDADYFGSRFDRVPYYERLMRPIRGKCTLLAFLVQDGQLLQKIGLGRMRGNRDFSARDLERLSSLVPTLTLACAARMRASARATVKIAALRATGLTRREREVVSYLRLGLSNAQIGLALGTRPRTVRNQLSSVYEKLGVATRAEAVGVAHELGLEPD